MSTYHPDRWAIMELTAVQGVHHRVIATWYGGFTGSDSWKISSGIEGCVLKDDIYSMLQTSGSTYECHTEGYGMGGYTGSIYHHYEEQAKNSNSELAIRLLTEEEAKTLLGSYV